MMILSESGYAPLSFWLGCSLVELGKWIDQHDKIVEEREKR